ncbi:hypothetical protein PORY_002228 [Pneumocystis oryctolagi]|uniref:Uncharacterized protein n=1 Tax=Pneumocystis oryctolagi TaxID=42067 RepID=A0ACB7CC53_9ASCO|nr:hypothetical protein PORY_002228 [Pneumocystis oryctolagi]
MDQSIEVLEKWIQQEQKVKITYLFLCKTMGIHMNDAKEILLNYYKKCQENNKKCHAIYMISGYVIEKTINFKPPLREEMVVSLNSTLDASTMSWELPVSRIKTFCLVKEEDIDDIKQKFDEIISIHVYALEYDSYKDISVLSDASLESSQIKYDGTLVLEEICKKYGTIYHPGAKDLSLVSLLPNKEILETKSENVSLETDLSRVNMGSLEESGKEKTASRSFFGQSGHALKSSFETDHKNVSKSTKKKSNIMKSFFNLNVNTDIKNEQTFLPSTTSLSENLVVEEMDNEHNIIKRQKEIDELKKMMIDQDDTTVFCDNVLKEDDKNHAKSSQTDVSKKKRGRRKVLKKVTSRDKKGYLVTKNEFVWESFSEDETSVPVVSKSDVGGFKETVGKTKTKLGETKITSFFSKK